MDGCVYRHFESDNRKCFIFYLIKVVFLLQWFHLPIRSMLEKINMKVSVLVIVLHDNVVIALDRL